MAVVLTRDVLKVVNEIVGSLVAPRSTSIDSSQALVILALLDQRLRAIGASPEQRLQARLELNEQVRIHNFAIAGVDARSDGEIVSGAAKGALEKAGEVISEATEKTGSLLTIVAVIAVALAVFQVFRK